MELRHLGRRSCSLRTDCWHQPASRRCKSRPFEGHVGSPYGLQFESFKHVEHPCPIMPISVLFLNHCMGLQLIKPKVCFIYIYIYYIYMYYITLWYNTHIRYIYIYIYSCPWEVVATLGYTLPANPFVYGGSWPNRQQKRCFDSFRRRSLPLGHTHIPIPSAMDQKTWVQGSCLLW